MKRKVSLGLFIFGFMVSGIMFGITTTLLTTAPHAKSGLTKEWTKNDSRQLAKSYVSVGFGWRGKEWFCLESLWTKESRWDFKADNPNSSAYGIAQLLGEKSEVPAIQILRGAKYIQFRYQTPCKALAFHHRNRWY